MRCGIAVEKPRSVWVKEHSSHQYQCKFHQKWHKLTYQCVRGLIFRSSLMSITGGSSEQMSQADRPQKWDVSLNKPVPPLDFSHSTNGKVLYWSWKGWLKKIKVAGMLLYFYALKPKKQQDSIRGRQKDPK